MGVCGSEDRKYMYPFTGLGTTYSSLTPNKIGTEEFILNQGAIVKVLDVQTLREVIKDKEVCKSADASLSRRQQSTPSPRGGGIKRKRYKKTKKKYFKNKRSSKQHSKKKSSKKKRSKKKRSKKRSSRKY